MPSGNTKTILKNKRRWSFLAHAFIWIIAISGGTAFAKLVYPDLVTPGRVSLAERVADYRESWAEALKRVGKHEPPPVEPEVAKAPWGQQSTLQIKLDQVYKDNLPRFIEEANKHLARLTLDFSADWAKCYDRFVDTPSVEEYCKRVHEHHREALKTLLVRYDEAQKAKKPRTRLALDSFSGYCVFRSEEFRDRAVEAKLKLHLIDDGADYEKRIKGLKSGDLEMAVFTLDALINNSALFDAPPAAVVLVLDETRGADAMVAYKDVFPNIASMNRPDTEIVLTPNSPSELLARLVSGANKLPKLPTECFVPAKDAEEVFKRFLEADPSEPKAFVLWQPFVSKALQDPRAHVLTDSSKFPGYIVDVLVARREFLETNKNEVREIVRAYQETAAEFQRSPALMRKLVQADSMELAAREKLPAALTDQEAKTVVEGIWWKTAEDNYAHFGLIPDPDKKHPPLPEMIENIAGVLTRAKVITKPVKASLLYHADVCGDLRAAGPRTPVDPWSRRKPVKDVKVSEVPFTAGSVKISELYEEDLTDLAKKLLAEDRYYVEVRGHARTVGDVDAQLAQERAEVVDRWLQAQGIAKNRIKLTVVKPASGSGPSVVSFVVLEDPK